MKVYIPSYGRAGHVTTASAIPSAKIVVPESQVEDYEKFYPNRVVSIPDEKDGNVAKKRNAILDLVPDGELFWMVDDDFKKAYRIKGSEVTDVLQLMESHWLAMESMGISYGGFQITPDPIKSAEYMPFSLTKQVYQPTCLRKTELRYDEELGRHEDVDYYLKVMLRDRLCLRDNRYHFEFQCNKDKSSTKQVGGIVGGEDSYKKSTDALIARWGNLIKIKHGRVNGVRSPVSGV